MALTHYNHPFRNHTGILLLLFVGAAFLLVSPAVAGTGVTVSADGTHSYYLGEKVVLRGQNSESDTMYLFLTGPNLPATGGKLTSPGTAAVSGNSDTFTVVKNNPDGTWEYSWYTANLPFDAGSYTLYAAGKPDTSGLGDPTETSISIILKKPFITANIAPATIRQGQPFTVTGTAEGNPPNVQVWIIGEDILYTKKATVNANASFTFTGNAAMSANLAPGEYYLFVQHPMQNNLFDIKVTGDYVNNGTNLFRIAGTGRLKGNDAADALIKAFNNAANQDSTYSHDTYTVIPFQVENVAADPVPTRTQHAPLTFAPIGSLFLIFGIAVFRTP